MIPTTQPVCDGCGNACKNSSGFCQDCQTPDFEMEVN